MSRSDAEPEDWSKAIEVMRKMLRRLKELKRGGIENRFSIEDHLILVYDAHPLAVPCCSLLVLLSNCTIIHRSKWAFAQFCRNIHSTARRVSNSRLCEGGSDQLVINDPRTSICQLTEQPAVWTYRAGFEKVIHEICSEMFARLWTQIQLVSSPTYGFPCHNNLWPIVSQLRQSYTILPFWCQRSNGDIDVKLSSIKITNNQLDSKLYASKYNWQIQQGSSHW